MSVRAVTTLAAAIGQLGSCPGHAQSLGTVDHFTRAVTTLEADVSGKPTAACDPAPPATRQSCALVAQIIAAERIATPEAVRPLRNAAERLVALYPEAPEAWYVLGRTRVALARAGLFAQAGALVPSGLSLNAGAVRAFARSVALRPSFTLAIAALARVPLPREGPEVFSEAITTLRTYRAGTPDDALPFVALLERAGGHSDSAVALGLRALARGQVDSGPVMLELARDLQRIGRRSEGRAMLLAGSGYESLETTQAYRRELSWIATPGELSEWDRLPPADRPTWLKVFWGKRDVREGRAEGERLAAHYERLEYALANYRLTIPQVGRSRSLTFARPTDFINEYRVRDTTRITSPEIARLVADSRTIGSESPFRYFVPFQDLVDDRGVVYIRHGPPTHSARTVGGDALELWVYDQPEGRRIVTFRDADFDGSVGASVLVPTLLTMPIPLRNQLCHLDLTLCAASQRTTEVTEGRPLEEEIIAEGNRLSSDAILASRTRGRAQIDTMTGTDRHPREFARRLEPVVQLYGLQRVPVGGGRAVVGFALRGSQLDSVSLPEAGGRTVYPIQIELAALRISDGVRFSLDTLRRFVTASPLRDEEYLTGVIDFPLPPGRYTVSAVFTQASGRGGMAGISEMTVPTAATSLGISDLVIGSPTSTVRWSSGLSSVSLHPLNSFRVADDAELYFQVSGAEAGTPFRAVYEVRVAEGAAEPQDRPQLSIAFDLVAPGPTWEISRTIGLANLPPGRYSVKVSLSGNGHSLTTLGRLNVLGR